LGGRLLSRAHQAACDHERQKERRESRGPHLLDITGFPHVLFPDFVCCRARPPVSPVPYLLDRGPQRQAKGAGISRQRHSAGDERESSGIIPSAHGAPAARCAPLCKSVQLDGPGVIATNIQTLVTALILFRRAIAADAHACACCCCACMAPAVSWREA
jgi:hypothetical protein